MSIFLFPRLMIALVVSATLSVAMEGQSFLGTDPKPGSLIGTVTDVNGDPVADATDLR